MNTFWLKMAGFVVVVIALVILVNVFLSSKDEPGAKPKTFYDIIKSDDERLRAEPKVEKPEVERPRKRQARRGRRARGERPLRRSDKPQQKEIAPEDKLQAEKLFEMALAQRKMARLPGMSYKLMVDYCRQILEKYPQSSYAPKARRMLRDIPERYRKLYKITDEEMGLSN